MPAPSIRSIEEFYAHALAIEREAAERYREFEAWFDDRGEEVLAGLCGSIGRMEEQHFNSLLQASSHLNLPALAPGEHLWLESGSPEVAARELFYRVAEPRHLLAIALQAERNAVDYFRWVARTSRDGAVRASAREMAQEEERHVDWVTHALQYHLTSAPAGARTL